MQYLANIAADGKGNIVISNGQLVNKETGDIVLGFNDQSKGNGENNANRYVDLATTGTNAFQFYLTDAEERAHNYTGNESIAKGVAKSELGYFNAVSWLSGTSTITNSNSNTGGVGTAIQNSWNQQYNANNNQLLAKNNQTTSKVSYDDMTFSTYFDKDGKLLKFKNDGDYNAYEVKESDWFYSKSENIKYADIMKFGNMIDKEKQAFEDSMTTNEAQADFYKMYLISDNGGTTAWSTLKSWFTGTPASKYDGMSLTERLTDVVKNDTLESYSLKTNIGGSYTLKNGVQINALSSFINYGADDFSLSILYANNLWKGIADSTTGIRNPTMTIGNAFGIDIDTSREIELDGF